MKNKILKTIAPLLLMIGSMASAFAQGIFNVSPDTLIWAANDLTPKEFDVTCRGAWQADVTSCQGLYQLSLTAGYDICLVSVTPLSANTMTTDRHVAVVITRSNGATKTLHLIHLAPEPEPEPDPWEGIADDLPIGQNWIQKTTVTDADGSAYRRDVSFYDGLGYVTQEVLVGASSGGTRSIYTPVEYDKLRRADARTYLPYASSTPAGVYDNAQLTHQAAFYANPATFNDSRPFAEKIYESFPSGRPLSFQREGDAWNGNGGHRSTISYRSNTSTEVIPKYEILPGTDYAKCVGTWPTGSLLCTETEDEEGSVSRSYADGFGRTVLTEQETGATLPGGAKEKARTLYVYDLRDSLTLVVQPEGMAALAALPANASRDLSLTAGVGTNGTVTDRYCFVWKRDGRGNIISEHVPGGGTVRMAYDNRGREVLRTDGRMDPSGGSGGSMVLTLHDQYDRVVGERYVTASSSSFATLQTMLRDTVLHTLPSYVVNAIFTTRATLRTAVYYPFGTFSYPSSGDAAFVPETGFAEQADLETTRIKGFLKNETVYPAPGVDGGVPSGAPSVTRYYHYDPYGRVIQTAERWSDGFYRRVSTKYSFTGDVLATKETVITPGSGTTSHSLATVYTRDGRGRVISCNRVLNGTNNLAAVNYDYDPLGRLAHKRVGENASGTSSLLETGYAYDLHGWTTEIEAGQRSALGALDTLFAETLHYASPEKDNQAGRFDGNISETGFKHRVGTSPSYTIQTNTWSYDYDGLKRLTAANHFAGSSGTSSLTDTEQGIGYDLNGNMTSLWRYNAAGLENDLTFLHTGNRMTSLTDANAVGSDAGAKAFTYDANGNLTHDGRKDLDIQWNIFNLASGAVTHDGSLTYARLSDGTLAFSRNVSGNIITGKRYCGSFVFAMGTGISTPLVESIAWDEGRIFRDAQTGMYRDCWFTGDHLGDVRSVVDISPNLSSPVVLEQNDFLPFGTKIANPLYAQMNTNRWRYAGKEEFPEVELLDFGARLYDPFTARWTAVDPLAEKYFSLNPFAYCTDNPVNLIDSYGMQWYSYTDNTGNIQYVYSEGRMPDDKRKQYNNLQYVGYTIVDKDNNKYYSLFGKDYDWNDSNGKPAIGQLYERIDELLIMRKLSPGRKVSMYIPGLPLGEIRNLGENCPFLYEGLFFSTIPVGSNKIKGLKSFGGESLYLGSIYWNNKDVNRPEIDTSLSAITEMPTSTRQRRVNTLRLRNGYYLIANNFIGKGKGSSTLVLLFDATNANAFLTSYNNIFRGHPNNK